MCKYKVGDTVYTIHDGTVVSGVVKTMSKEDNNKLYYTLTGMNYINFNGAGVYIYKRKEEDLYTKKEVYSKLLEKSEKSRQRLISKLLEIEKLQSEYRKLFNDE
jgi:hypothetical protein